MRILRSYGMMDKPGDGSSIDWEGYRRLSPVLEKKTDEELQVRGEGVRLPNGSEI